MARPGVGFAQLPPGCTPRRAVGATAAPSSPRRSPLPTLLRLPLLRPHALLGFATGIGRCTGWCGGRRRCQIRLTELLPPGALGAQTNEPRARTGLPGPTGWWPRLGSGDGPGAWLDRNAVREMYREKAGAGGPPALPGSHHLRSGYPGLVPATWAVSGAWGRLSARVLPVT